MFYKTFYPSPIGLITLGCKEDHLVGLWIENQKYYEDTVEEEMIPKDDMPVRERGWIDISREKSRKFQSFRWLPSEASSGRRSGRFCARFLTARSRPTAKSRKKLRLREIGKLCPPRRLAERSAIIRFPLSSHATGWWEATEA